MRVEFHGQPAYTLAVCYLDHDETIRVESGAMATMSASIDVSADAGPGGLVKGLIRKQLGGESLFMGRYKALTHNAWVAVAPHRPGDIIDIDIDPNGPAVIAESGSLLAMSEGVAADVRWAGVRAIVLREGATMLRLDGTGKALLCTYGGFVRHTLAAGQEIIVDTGHLVAYDDTITMQVGMLQNAVTASLTGEGLVAKMTATAPGRVWVQTRSEESLTSWLLPDRAQNREG